MTYRSSLFLVSITLLLAVTCTAQSRTNRLQRPCPGTSIPPTVDINGMEGKKWGKTSQPCPDTSHKLMI